MARFLAGSLEMDFVCIDRLEGDGLSARTVAVWCDGHFQDNVTYALKDTPCGELLGKEVCCFPASVGRFFPAGPGAPGPAGGELPRGDALESCGDSPSG